MRARARMLALALALAGGAEAAEELVLPPVVRETFDNGLRVAVAEYRELPLVELYAIVGAGAAQDPAERPGLAALTARTLTRGTAALSAEALAEAIESLGGTIEASGGVEGTVVQAEFLAKDFRAGLDLVRQVLREPEFRRDEVRRARDEQVAAVLAAREHAAAVADKCFGGLLYGAHPYGRPVEGHPESVARLGRGEVRDFHDRWYRPNNTILVLVGDLAAPAALAALREALGDWRARPDAIAERPAAPEGVTRRRVLLVDKPDATQSHIAFGNVAIARAHPDHLAATIASTILGGGFTSRLIEELRVKRSLTYGAWSTFVARRAGGDFRVGTFTKSATTVETLALALEVTAAFRETASPADALEKARSFLRGQFPLKLEAPEALAAGLAEIMFHDLPADELTSYRSRVAALPAAAVAAAAARHMPAPDATAVVVVGRAEEIRAPLEARFGPVEVVAVEACERPMRPR